MICADVPVMSVEHLTAGYFLLKLNSPSQAELARPGQFFMLGMPYGKSSCDPLLNRPISVLDIQGKSRKTPGEIHFLIKEVGRGTRLLSRLRENDVILCHGPLGNRFPEPGERDRVLLVGGGVGIAPLYYCARQWSDGTEMVLFYGGKNRDELPLSKLFGETALAETALTTEDGSWGIKGLVTEPLEKYLASNPVDRVYCCGPNPMMEIVAQLMAHSKDKLWLSMENRMGCGLGACLGCALPVKSEDNISMVRVCKEGPVFTGDRIIWETR